MVIVVGVFGNLLVFLVYLKKFKSSATRVFVLAMTVCDLYTAVFGLPLVIYGMRYNYTSEAPYCKMKILLGPLFTVIISYSILVFVALDRRRRICKPLERQYSARQASYLLMIPLMLSSAVIFFLAFLYSEIPLETERPEITGSTCGFLDRWFGMQAKQIYGIVVMTYFLVGFAVLTTCYVQISYQIYQQKKRLFIAGKVNVDTRSGITKTCREEPAVSDEKILQTDTNTHEDTIDSNRKSDVGVQELIHLEEDARIETHTWLSKDMQEKSRLVINELCKKSIFCKDTFELEVHADKHDTEARSGQNEISRCSSVPEVSGADCVMSMSFKQEMLDMSQDPGIENLSEPVTNNEGGGHEDNIIDVYCHRVQTGKENQRKRGLLSRTTLMMLVLTISMVICCLPNFVVALANVQFENVHLSPWKTNIYHLARTFPSINCALNPFIYSFCNIKFRLQCRQFLTNMRNAVFRQD
ncbi:uncharacterized protein LOC112569109 [Pomacea canaliculata]|uniref:uncharacterized protein LOC112569109 n=1 Tax=Pomacea canaliculata TaxID=400727 RepID=UPI000D726B74|nr:uncharacterized protein LOC112569109 [Pomacea canaliculata]